MSRRCIRCNLNIADDALECPLCHGVLDIEEDITNGMDRESKSLIYPDVTSSLKVMQLIIRIICFAAIVIEAVLLVINYLTFNGVYWSLIVAAGMVYGILTLLYSFRDRKSLQNIILVEMLLAVVFLIVLDYLTGKTGWAYTYALPILFMAVDAGAVIFMIVGIDGWQTYIISEIVTATLSLILLILVMADVVPGSIFTIIALGVTASILLGTLMMGSRMVHNEVKRRFKI